MTAPTGECAAAGCTRLADPVICAVDTRRLGDWLAQLGDEFAALDAAPSMAGREPGTGGSGTLSSQRSVARLDVLVLRDRRSRPRYEGDPDGTRGRSVPEVLGYWADAVRDARRLTPPGLVRHTLPVGGRPPGPLCDRWCGHESCVRWTLRGYTTPPRSLRADRRLLADHLTWIVEQHAAGRFFDDIREIIGLLRAANGAVRTPAVRCRRDVGGVECGGRVTLAEGTATCGGCGHTATGLALARAGAA